MANHPHPLAALLEIAQDDAQRHPVYPIEEAQIEELKLILREHAERETFEHGDRVEYKHARGPLRDVARAKLVLVFWRYLDLKDETDQRRLDDTSEGERAVASNLDCLIGYLREGRFAFDVADSSALRKVGRLA